MIKSANDLERLRKAFYCVFHSRNPFSPAGGEELMTKTILYETDLYYLNFEQFQALIGAVRASGEQEFFISMVETEADPFSLNTWNENESAHWICEEPVRFEEYRGLNLFIENAIYSSNGTWGFLLSHEFHALLVCQPQFWDAFRAQYPNWQRDLKDFAENWRHFERERGVATKWLQPLLDHLTLKPE